MTTPNRRRVCRCNGLLMLSRRPFPNVTSYWCPHMESHGQVDISRHLEWQQLNKIPDWLCKVRRIPAAQP